MRAGCCEYGNGFLFAFWCWFEKICKEKRIDKCSRYTTVTSQAISNFVEHVSRQRMYTILMALFINGFQISNHTTKHKNQVFYYSIRSIV